MWVAKVGSAREKIGKAGLFAASAAKPAGALGFREGAGPSGPLGYGSVRLIECLPRLCVTSGEVQVSKQVSKQYLVLAQLTKMLSVCVRVWM